MKRWGLLSLFLVLLLGLLAACSDSSEDTEKEDEGSAAEESPSGNLVIYTGRDEGMVQEVIAKFNERYPDCLLYTSPSPRD